MATDLYQRRDPLLVRNVHICSMLHQQLRERYVLHYNGVHEQRVSIATLVYIHIVCVCPLLHEVRCCIPEVSLGIKQVNTKTRVWCTYLTGG